MKRLGDCSHGQKKQENERPDEVASRLIEMGKIQLCKDHSRTIKSELKRQKKLLQQDDIVGALFTINKVDIPLSKIKINKAAGFDGVYPEFIKYSGPRTREWLSRFYSDILATAIIPEQFKRTKVIALLKPGTSGSEAADYRSISLLSIPYKILERLILERIQPCIDEVIPVEQAGFRHNRGCEEQVLALTTLIENGLQKKLKTSVAFIDLSAAYDTVW
jgi:hypothetical protein